MRILAVIFIVLTALGACSKFDRYTGPEVTRILVYKEAREMFLMHNDEVLRRYEIGLGFSPAGHKEQEGDGRTPEGDYVIDRRNPESEFYLSLGLSYPNEDDIAQAKELGVDPGGDIFIHGRPWKYRKAPQDWTWGCIAVSNKEMREIYSMVRIGTVISVYP